MDYCASGTMPAEREIMDPIHGTIGCNALEIAAIDHPLFQRLRDIRQNDVLRMVFPGATHSRFEHGLGVMHMAGRMAASMLGHSAPQAIMSNASAHQAACTLYQAVRLAALLHDVGHGPFSHLFEKTRTAQRLLDDPEAFCRLWSASPERVSRLYTQKPQRLRHEHLSVYYASQLLEDLTAELVQADLQAEEVLCLMETVEHIPERFAHKALMLYPALAGVSAETAGVDAHQAGRELRDALRFLISSEFDADRGDYLLRDAYYTGVTAWQTRMDRIPESLRIVRAPATGRLVPAVLEHACSELDAFLLHRHRMHRHIYTHHAAVGMELVGQNALDGLFAKGNHNPWGMCWHERICRGVQGDIREWLDLTDDLCNAALRARISQDRWAHQLITRQPMKTVFESTQMRPHDELRAYQRKLEAEHPGSRFVLSSKVFRSAKGELDLHLIRRGAAEGDDLVPIQQVNLVPALSEPREDWLVRIYQQSP